MAGLVGANDNGIGYVGIAPFALTWSMKISHNTYVSNSGCGFWKTSRTECFEDDDFIAGADWASHAGLRVLSMSFGKNLNSSTRDALYRAYYHHDILLLAAVANVASDPVHEPASLSYVVGVGGLDAQGTAVGMLQYRELSAYSYGGTTRGYCSGTAFCVPFEYTTSGGTSAATATTAGVAGLLRAYHPTMSAAQARSRLRSTATGSLYRIDALAAITYVPPLSVHIFGRTQVPSWDTETWYADASGGSYPYSYYWLRDGVFVGSESTYTGNGSSERFELWLRVTDAAGRVVWNSLVVNDSNASCPDPTVACEVM